MWLVVIVNYTTLTNNIRYIYIEKSKNIYNTKHYMIVGWLEQPIAIKNIFYHHQQWWMDGLELCIIFKLIFVEQFKEKNFFYSQRVDRGKYLVNSDMSRWYMFISKQSVNKNLSFLLKKQTNKQIHWSTDKPVIMHKIEILLLNIQFLFLLIDS